MPEPSESTVHSLESQRAHVVRYNRLVKLGWFVAGLLALVGAKIFPEQAGTLYVAAAAALGVGIRTPGTKKEPP